MRTLERTLIILTGIGITVSCAYYDLSGWTYFAAVITILYAGTTDPHFD